MPPSKPLVSVLITSYNRRSQTMRCLNSLYDQGDDHALQVTLVDDNSTDATAESVKEEFPEVNVIPGTGDLFWGGGMRLAHLEASKLDYDFLLWLNDDVILFPSALTTLVTTYRSSASQIGNKFLVVGALRDPDQNMTSYSGLTRDTRWRPLRFRTLEPTSQPIECDTMNGNLVLIPKPVVDLVGPIDGAFPHAIGDLDYGLRARKTGCRIILAPGHLGLCSRNTIKGTHLDPSLSLLTILKQLASTKVIPPKSWATFARRHGGPLWPLFWASPYLRGASSAIAHAASRKIGALLHKQS